MILTISSRLAYEQLFFVTVTAFDALAVEDIERATGECIRRGFTCDDDWFWRKDEPDNGMMHGYCGRLEQIFTVTSTSDGRMHALVMPGEAGEGGKKAFGPGPFSEHYQPYSKDVVIPEVRSHADFNMVIVADTTVTAVGWAFIRDSVLRFSQGDFGGHSDSATALLEGARYQLDGQVMRISVGSQGDALIVTLPKIAIG